MKLSKHILAAAAAATLSIAAMASPSYAEESDHPYRHRMSAEDRAALLDARIAALKAGLELTPDQELGAARGRYSRTGQGARRTLSRLARKARE